MPAAKVSALRSIELGVSNINRSIAFYTNAWGLEIVHAHNGMAYLRATGAEHHVVTLRERPAPKLLSVQFSAPDRDALDALYASACALGISIVRAPAALEKEAGGGYGFSLQTPDGQELGISAAVARHDAAVEDTSKPMNLTHVVINSGDVVQQTSFFQDALGFELSDSTDSTEFIRCGRDHHSIALARGSGPSLNHMAYDMPHFDGLMSGSGRTKLSGFDVEWALDVTGQATIFFRTSSSLMVSSPSTPPGWSASTTHPIGRTTRSIGERSSHAPAVGAWRCRRQSASAKRCQVSSCRSRKLESAATTL
jgi:catechol-2,3-dioxygenase